MPHTTRLPPSTGLISIPQNPPPSAQKWKFRRQCIAWQSERDNGAACWQYLSSTARRGGWAQTAPENPIRHAASAGQNKGPQLLAGLHPS